MKVKILLILTILLLANSCKTIDMVFNSDNYIRRDGIRDVEIRYDTVWLNNNDGNVSNAVVAGIKPTKKIVFDKIGQSYTLYPDETIELITDGVDYNNAAFDIITDVSTKNITLKLIDKDNAKVILTKKCETVERFGIDFVPKIEVAEGLDPEQIVVTPLFDNNCIRTGYEIRYGSIESGCKKEAKNILKRFNDCTGKNQSKQKTKIKDDCKLLRKLGIPCN